MFIFLFFILFLLELDRYRYDVEIYEFYTNNLNDMAKSLINSWLLITNYNNYRFSLNLCPIHNKLIENHDKLQEELEDALNNYYIINPGIFDEELYQENENYGYYCLKYYGNIKTSILPTLNKINAMCSEYPGLSKAFDNFKMTYKMVHQDWLGKNKVK